MNPPICVGCKHYKWINPEIIFQGDCGNEKNKSRITLLYSGYYKCELCLTCEGKTCPKKESNYITIKLDNK